MLPLFLPFSSWGCGFLKHICLFIFVFGCTRPSLLLWPFSSCSEQQLLSSCSMWASHRGGFLSSLVAERGLLVCGLQWLWCTDLVASQRGIFWDHGSISHSPHWQADSQPQDHQRSPKLSILICLFKVLHTSWWIYSLRFSAFSYYKRLFFSRSFLIEYGEYMGASQVAHW